MKLTIREAAERYNVPFSTLHQACVKDRLRYTLEKGPYRNGRMGLVRMVRSSDVEAYVGGSQTDGLTVLEVAERLGLADATVNHAISRGKLQAKKETRRVTRKDGAVQGVTMWIVSEEDLAEYMVARKERKPRAKPRAKRRPAKRYTSVNNPYPEHWRQGKVPDHLRDEALRFWMTLKAGVD